MPIFVALAGILALVQIFEGLSKIPAWLAGHWGIVEAILVILLAAVSLSLVVLGAMRAAGAVPHF